jgi:hypothetical protein
MDKFIQWKKHEYDAFNNVKYDENVFTRLSGESRSKISNESQNTPELNPSATQNSFINIVGSKEN